MSKKERITIGVVVLVFCICNISLWIYIINDKSSKEPVISQVEVEEKEATDLMSNNEVTIAKTELESEEIAASSAVTDIASVHETSDEEIEMISDEAIVLHDIYAEAGCMVEFKCFDRNAVSYEWEYYNLQSKNWIRADDSKVKARVDELGRNIAVFQVNADAEMHELMTRCIIHYEEKEDVVQTASLFILKDAIVSISVEDIETDVNSYLCTNEIPVKVHYADGTYEIVTGLYNLYFVSFEETKDYSTTISGNRIETLTTVATECDYHRVALDQQEVLLRHRSVTENEIDVSGNVLGKDLIAPEILEFEVSPFEVSNVDEEVILTINIAAEDNETPYPYLEYAFVLSGEEPKPSDWIRKASFDVAIHKNGIYIAYVKDEAGNISQKEKEIITVDMIPPMIDSIKLSNEVGWCKNNTIMVEASDAGIMHYRFTCIGNDSDSGWITYSEYSVNENGTWMVQIRDAAGNIEESELVINNIDNEAPSIREIKIKENK